MQGFIGSEAMVLNRLAHWVVGEKRLSTAASGRLPENVGSGAQGKLFFLFLARDSLPTEKIWMKFFASGKQSVDYHAIVHCTDESACRKSLGGQDQFTVISSSPSRWCADLVTPMNALLAAALKSEGGSLRDKFIFLSESTVPIKSFQHVQHQLLVEDGIGSSFCVHPWHRWAWHDGTDVAVKHDQWIVLNRQHAQQSLDFSVDEVPITFLRTLTPLVWGNVEWLSKWMYLLSHDYTVRLLGSIYFSALHFFAFIGPPYVGGCTDEFWHFAAAFDYVSRQAGTSGIKLSGLSGSPQLVMNETTVNMTQGRCHTYTHFRPDEDHFVAFTELLQRTPGTKLATAHDTKHPTHFEQLSEQTMATFLQSPFLFARKVDDHTSFEGPLKLAEAFDRYIYKVDGGIPQAGDTTGDSVSM